MTIKEIAALANVSTSTVSKIINGKDSNISPATRSKVLKIVKEHHYEPYGTVKSITAPKKFLIGLLLNSLSNISPLLSGILKASQEYGYQLLVFNSNGLPEEELKHITALCNARADGVIWEPVNAQSSEHAHLFTRHNISVHCLNAPEGFLSYEIDFEKAGYELTQKMIQKKHTHIACLLRKNDSRSKHFQEGVQKCLYDHKISLQNQQVLYSPVEAPYSSIIAHKVTGIVSAYHSDAILLYEQLENMHYHIPSTLSLAGLQDEGTEENYYFPHISCIKIPYHDFGYYICRSLIRICEKTSEDGAPLLFSPDYVFTHQKSISMPSSFRSKKLVVVGSINMDITFIVDRLPQAGKTNEILTSVTSVGGKGANQSVGAAKLGREVSIIGKLGSDLDSTVILNTLEKEHVSVYGISYDMNAPSGKAYIYTGEDGESTITILPGANRSLLPENIQTQKQLFDNARFCLLSTEIPINTIMETARTAYAAKVDVILKPAVLKSLPEELYLLTNIFVPNQKEASVLCPHEDTVPAQAEFFYQKGIQTVIITLGDQGCYLKDADGGRYFPAADFIPVDTTGGADAFISALASYLMEGCPMEQAVRIATFAAGFCISRQGAVSSLTDRNTLETYIAQNAPELLVKKEKAPLLAEKHQI